MKLEGNLFFDELLSLELPENDFAVFGSGPLYIHGLREEIHDIDGIARGEAWERVLELGKAQKLEDGATKVKLFGEDLEFFNDWGPGEWDVDQLIDEAEVFEKVRFVQLKDVLKWKKMLMREKDVEDISRIEEFLKKRAT